MMSIGYVTRYSGLDAILGLAFARTGWFYPLFGTLLGWLGVVLPLLAALTPRQVRQEGLEGRERAGPPQGGHYV